MGHGFTLADFERVQRSVPVVGKYKPSSKYNIDDFHQAGGVPTLLKSIAESLDLRCAAPWGRPWEPPPSAPRRRGYPDRRAASGS